jgi:hypothetical protein
MHETRNREYSVGKDMKIRIGSGFLTLPESVLLINANALNILVASLLQDPMSQKKKDIRSSNYSYVARSYDGER